MYGIADSLIALLFLGVLLLTAKLAEEVFERIRLVPYVASIFIGIVIGPGVLGLITIIPNISLFISLGINFLLFAAGALEFKELNMSGLFSGRSLAIGVAEFLIPFGATTFVAYILFKSLLIASIIGIVIGMSSAGPLTRLLNDTGLSRTEDGNSIFRQVVIIEVSAVILFSFVTELNGNSFFLLSVVIITVKLLVALVLIILFGKYVLTRFLMKMDLSARAHETVIAIIVSFILILGFIGQYVGFNSAIVALFLGIMLRDFIGERPIVGEKISTITYGFFEPLFFVGLGLYFVRLNSSIIMYGLLLFATGLLIKPLAGMLFAKASKIDMIKNALGTSVHGGVDAALLVVALTPLAIVTRYDYSIVMFAISLLTLAVPLIFSIGSPVVPTNKSKFLWNIVESEFKSIKVENISKTLPTYSVKMSDRLFDAFQMCVKNNIRGVIVTNSRGMVRGQIALMDLLTLSHNRLRTLSVYESNITPAIKIKGSDSATDLLRLFREYDPPIVAVVDESGKFIGTVIEREMLRHISDIIAERALG
ncbi:MAG: cation:proton antiporter [Candidatus Thermoplasmatota archaeon]|nr:cation:proton antiporter [Candidatus Thermoplasmatota archaeon]MCL5731488.1 cation:proton antiporter [Candidatus Thermoplasmatota archaeon]